MVRSRTKYLRLSVWDNKGVKAETALITNLIDSNFYAVGELVKFLCKKLENYLGMVSA